MSSLFTVRISCTHVDGKYSLVQINDIKFIKTNVSVAFELQPSNENGSAQQSIVKDGITDIYSIAPFPRVRSHPRMHSIQFTFSLKLQ